MSTFPLRVGTPDGLLYEGDVARVVLQNHQRRPGNSAWALQLLHCTWYGRGAYCAGGRNEKKCRLHRRNAFHDERGLPCPGNNLGVGRGY